MSEEPNQLGEAELSEQLGVNRAQLRTVRTTDLERGSDWNHVAGAIQYTKAGLEKVLRLLKISRPAPPAPAAPPPAEHSAPKNPPEAGTPAAPPAPPAPGDVRELVMLQTFHNPRIVLARLGDAEVRVRVKDSAKLIRGMKMKCRLLQGDLWSLAQPLPRRRGKW